jgi:hypothetical protein
MRRPRAPDPISIGRLTIALSDASEKLSLTLSKAKPNRVYRAHGIAVARTFGSFKRNLQVRQLIRLGLIFQSIAADNGKMRCLFVVAPSN